MAPFDRAEAGRGGPGLPESDHGRLDGAAQVQKDVTEPAAYTDLDLAYVDASRSWSGPRLARYDLGILWKTVKLMARGEGLRY